MKTTQNDLAGQAKVTPQQKAVVTTKLKHGEDFYKVIGKRAGEMSPSAPFKDVPGLASKAINARWERYYAMTVKEREEYKEKLRLTRATNRAAKKKQAKKKVK
jgi:hypothetical protein